MRLCCTSNQNMFKASLVFLAGNPGEEIYGNCFKASSGKKCCSRNNTSDTKCYKRKTKRYQSMLKRDNFRYFTNFCEYKCYVYSLT